MLISGALKVTFQRTKSNPKRGAEIVVSWSKTLKSAQEPHTHFPRESHTRD